MTNPQHPAAARPPLHDVAHLGHIELLTPKLCESLWFFVDVLGLTETCREDNSVYLRTWDDYEHLHEEPQALAEPGRQQLDVPEVRDIVQRRPRRRRVLRAGHRDLRGKTVPSKSLRAVRTTPERITVGGWLVVSTSASTSR